MLERSGSVVMWCELHQSQSIPLNRLVPGNKMLLTLNDVELNGLVEAVKCRVRHILPDIHDRNS